MRPGPIYGCPCGPARSRSGSARRRSATGGGSARCGSTRGKTASSDGARLMAVIDLPHLGPGATADEIATWAAILKGSLETAFTELGNATSGGAVVRGPPG